MGSAENDPDASDEEKPQHTVFLDSFWIDKKEVTNKQFKKCVMLGVCPDLQNKGSRTHENYFLNLQYDDYPVISVNWVQAQSYCHWAGRRLPSEAEWEKAARGADGHKYPWGNNKPTCEIANFRSDKFECVGDTKAVGSYPTNVSFYGAFDMAGNVAEWVNDWHGADYYLNSPPRNPPGPEQREWRVIRGGSWTDDFKNIRGAARNGDGPETSTDSRGFRCAR
jgi:formylglycine-generating enzyme required for sulfatase activity